MRDDLTGWPAIEGRADRIEYPGIGLDGPEPANGEDGVVPVPPRSRRVRRTGVSFVGAAVALVGLAVAVTLLRLEAPLSSETGQTIPATSLHAPQPLVSDLSVRPGVPLRIVAIRPNDPSIAIVDLESGLLSEYPPGSHPFPADAIDGVAVTPTRQLVVWSDRIARLVPDDLSSVTRALEPTELRSLEDVAPSLRVVPLPDGERAWLVQPGATTSSGVIATVVELVDLSSGESSFETTLEADSFPAASTSSGLVLNSREFLSTEQGLVIDPSSQRIVHLRPDGTVADISPGEAIGANSETIAVLQCPRNSSCDLHSTNKLVLVSLDSDGLIEVTKPDDEVWITVGGPMIPSEAMPLETVSPDGSTLLMSLGTSLDVNDKPAESAIVAIDLTDGVMRTLAHFDGVSPIATWSLDGRWVALLNRVEAARIDIELINIDDPSNTIALEDAFPIEHFPLAAG